MKSLHCPPAILSILFTLTLLHVIPSAAVVRPSPTTATASTNNKTTEFIRTNCQTTSYPDLCYDSLSRYASAIRQDPARLARAAMGVSLAKAKHTATYFNNLAKQAEYISADGRIKGALDDCLSVLHDAVDEINDSLVQIKSVGRGGRGGLETFKFLMSNVQTWMSAALSDEGTCTDGFDEINADRMNSIKRDVYDPIQRTEEVTSNALALVNSYVASVVSV